MVLNTAPYIFPYRIELNISSLLRFFIFFFLTVRERERPADLVLRFLVRAPPRVAFCAMSPIDSNPLRFKTSFTFRLPSLKSPMTFEISLKAIGFIQGITFLVKYEKKPPALRLSCRIGHHIIRFQGPSSLLPGRSPQDHTSAYPLPGNRLEF